MKQFSAIELLEFLTRFVKLYRKHYDVNLVLPIDKDTGVMTLAHPSFISFLEMDSSHKNKIWEIQANSNMSAQIASKPELMELSSGFIKMFP